MRLYELRFEYNIEKEKITSITYEISQNNGFKDEKTQNTIQKLENILTHNLGIIHEEKQRGIITPENTIEHERTYNAEEINASIKTNINLNTQFNTSLITINTEGKKYEKILGIYQDIIKTPTMQVSDDAKKSIKKIEYLLAQQKFNITNYLKFLNENYKK